MEMDPVVTIVSIIIVVASLTIIFPSVKAVFMMSEDEKAEGFSSDVG